MTRYSYGLFQQAALTLSGLVDPSTSSELLAAGFFFGFPVELGIMFAPLQKYNSWLWSLVLGCGWVHSSI
jgi:hypothetical protein